MIDILPILSATPTKRSSTSRSWTSNLVAIHTLRCKHFHDIHLTSGTCLCVYAKPFHRLGINPRFFVLRSTTGTWQTSNTKMSGFPAFVTCFESALYASEV